MGSNCSNTQPCMSLHLGNGADIQAIISGGPVAVIWGELAAGVGNLAIAASLAELCTFPSRIE